MLQKAHQEEQKEVKQKQLEIRNIFTKAIQGIDTEAAKKTEKRPQTFARPRH